jgi:hypothetical protein
MSRSVNGLAGSDHTTTLQLRLASVGVQGDQVGWPLSGTVSIALSSVSTERHLAISSESKRASSSAYRGQVSFSFLTVCWGCDGC